MDLKNIRFIGRHLNKEGREYFSFSGSGFEFAIVPQSDSYSITFVLTSELREHDEQYIGIYVNDVFHSKEKLVAGLNRIAIKFDDPQSYTVVRVIKYNEVYLSAIYLEDILLENAIFGESKPLNKKLIGFFGDSITCGYGLDEFKGTGFKMSVENFSLTYAYLTAKALNLEYTVVARSGISIGIKIWVDKLFNEIYDTVDMFEKCPVEHNLDYAVINLGTNDNSGYFQAAEDKEKALKEFHQEYTKLVDRIIKDNPNVKIVISYGMCYLSDLFMDEIKKLYENLSKQFKNDFRIVEFVPNDEGTDCHPYKTSHENNANLLIDAINSFK